MPRQRHANRFAIANLSNIGNHDGMLSPLATLVTMVLFGAIMAGVSGSVFLRGRRTGVVETGFGEIVRASRPNAFRLWMAAYGAGAVMTCIEVVLGGVRLLQELS